MRCAVCNALFKNSRITHTPDCTNGRPVKRDDTRKTSPEKLEASRELANDMAREAAREPNNEAMQKLARYSERLHRILDGEW